jgi:hypothetical protein
VTPRRTLLAVGLIALSVAGCGFHDPYNDPPAGKDATPAPAPSAPTDAHANSDAQPPRDRAAPGSFTTASVRANAHAEEVAAAYGLAQTNWSWRTYRGQYRRMTELAGGALARDLRANPPEPDQLRGIEADRQTNRATAVAVDGRVLSPAKIRVIVVYEELAGGAGVTDRAPRHTVYRAVVSRLAEGWKVTQWSLLP